MFRERGFCEWTMKKHPHRCQQQNQHRITSKSRYAWFDNHIMPSGYNVRLFDVRLFDIPSRKQEGGDDRIELMLASPTHDADGLQSHFPVRHVQTGILDRIAMQFSLQNCRSQKFKSSYMYEYLDTTAHTCIDISPNRGNATIGVLNWP